MILTIYLIGFIAAHYFNKLYLNRGNYDSWRWNDVGFSLIVSVFSWFYIALWLLFLSINYLINKIKLPPKPPKWL